MKSKTCLLTGIAFALGLSLYTPVVGQTFYPSSPDLPRIQFLKTLKSEADLKKKQHWFIRFLFGSQQEDEWVRNAVVKPYAVAFSDGELIVSDTPTGVLFRFNVIDQAVSRTRGSGRGSLRSPQGVAIDGQGRILVTDTSLNEMLILAPDGTLITRLGSGILGRPSGIAVEGDSAFVADAGINDIVVFDLQTGGHRMLIGADEPRLSPIGVPTDVAVAPDGSLYICETMAGRVTHYSRDGERIAVIGDIGGGLGQFGAPKGAVVDREGRLYVTDSRYDRIQLFDRYGRLLLVFGDSPEEDERLSLPGLMAIDYSNNEYWQQYAVRGFQIEYVIAVTSQMEPAAICVYGFGRKIGEDYPEDPPPDDYPPH